MIGQHQWHWGWSSSNKENVSCHIHIWAAFILRNTLSMIQKKYTKVSMFDFTISQNIVFPVPCRWYMTDMLRQKLHAVKGKVHILKWSCLKQQQAHPCPWINFWPNFDFARCPPYTTFSLTKLKESYMSGEKVCVLYWYAWSWSNKKHNHAYGLKVDHIVIMLLGLFWILVESH